MVAGVSLADGQLAATKTTIFTATDVTYIKFLTFFNTSAVTQTVKVYEKRFGSVSRQIRQIVLLQNQSYRYVGKDDADALSIGDEIEAETTTANVVDFMVKGGVA